MIRFSHVVKEYPRTGLALQDVTFRVNKGEFAFLTGPSGAGKSTILRLVIVEETPTAGEVRVSGSLTSSLPRSEIPRLRRKIGVVFQDFRLLEYRTAEENVAFALEVTGAPRDTISAPVRLSSAPVGSSASTISGEAISARAIATRCCSPPESWRGK